MNELEEREITNVRLVERRLLGQVLVKLPRSNAKGRSRGAEGADAGALLSPTSIACLPSDARTLRREDGVQERVRRGAIFPLLPLGSDGAERLDGRGTEPCPPDAPQLRQRTTTGRSRSSSRPPRPAAD